MAYNAMGAAIRNEIAIHIKKSLLSINNISEAVAPLIFLIPISLTLLRLAGHRFFKYHPVKPLRTGP